MRYIRTKDGIYEVLRESETKKSCITKKSGLVIHKDKVVAQADTIEELCDEFVVTGDLIINRVFDSMQETDKWKHLYSKMKITIYGAIWTDKGLIYVAKMNDKGELELL